jgi:hypothetical protein
LTKQAFSYCHPPEYVSIHLAHKNTKFVLPRPEKIAGKFFRSVIVGMRIRPRLLFPYMPRNTIARPQRLIVAPAITWVNRCTPARGRKLTPARARITVPNIVPIVATPNTTVTSTKAKTLSRAAVFLIVKMNVLVEVAVRVDMLNLAQMGVGVCMWLFAVRTAQSPDHIHKSERDKQPRGKVAAKRFDKIQLTDSHAQRYSDQPQYDRT